MLLEGYKMTELGEIPKEWEVVKLSDERLIQKMKAGGTPLSSSENYYKNGSIPFVKIEDMTRSGKYLFKTEFKITDEGLKNCSAWLVPKDSIIYSMYASFGEAAINKIPVATNQAIIAIIPLSAADVEYLYYALWNLKPSLHKYLRETTQKNLNAEVVKNLYLSLPPSSERHRIAEILSTVGETIEHTEALIEKYRNIKKGLMADLLTRGIDEEGRIRSEETHRFKDSPLGKIPEEWEVVELNDCADIRLSNVDKKISKDELPVLLCNYLEVYKNEYITGSMPFMVGSAKREEIEKFRVFKDDAIITKDSEEFNDIAKPAYVAEEIDNLICGYHLAMLRPKDDINGLFLSKALQLHNVNIFFQNRANGITRFGISKNTIETALIPLPPLSEQHRIAEILTAADERIEKEETYREKILQIKKGLMQDLLTGRVRVKVPQEAQS